MLLASLLGCSLPEQPELSAVTVGDPAHSDLLLYGFWEPEDDWRWMSERAAVRLKRLPEHTGWRLRGWIDLSLHGVDRLLIGGRAEGGPMQHLEITETGPFEFEGPLGEASASQWADLEFECDHWFVPGEGDTHGDTRSLCVVAHAVELY